MDKLRFIARQFDGTTPVVQSPEFHYVDGWTQAAFHGPAGIFPAGLWGKVPGGDPYLLHISASTTGPMSAGDLVELQSGAPMQPRRQYRPTPDNTVILLVRPTDRIRLQLAPQQEIAVELLVESIGGVNELGSRLFGWSHAAQAGLSPPTAAFTITQPTNLTAWRGLLHVIHDSPNPDHISLPPRSLVPLDVTLTFTRRGVGMPVLAAAVGDTLAGGLPAFAVTRSVVVHNNGSEWAFAGI